MADPANQSNMARLWAWWVDARAIRWGAAALLVVVALMVALWVKPTECRDQLSQVGDQAVVKVCGPVGVTDLSAVVGLMLLFLLLAPDLTEVSIGVLSVKQRVKEAESQQAELGAEVATLRQDLAVTQQSIQSAVQESAQLSLMKSDQNVSVRTEVPPPDVAAVVREVVAGLLARPGLDEARASVPEVDSFYARELGELALLLSRVEFLITWQASRFWRVDSRLPEPQFPINLDEFIPSLKSLDFFGMLRLDPRIQAEQFADLRELVVNEVRGRFVTEYERPLALLRYVRVHVANGLIPPETRHDLLVETARTLLGALQLAIGNLPDQPADTEDDAEDGESPLGDDQADE